MANGWLGMLAGVGQATQGVGQLGMQLGVKRAEEQRRAPYMRVIADMGSYLWRADAVPPEKWQQWESAMRGAPQDIVQAYTKIADALGRGRREALATEEQQRLRRQQLELQGEEMKARADYYRALSESTRRQAQAQPRQEEGLSPALRMKVVDMAQLYNWNAEQAKRFEDYLLGKGPLPSDLFTGGGAAPPNDEVSQAIKELERTIAQTIMNSPDVKDKASAINAFLSSVAKPPSDMAGRITPAQKEAAKVLLQLPSSLLIRGVQAGEAPAATGTAQPSEGTQLTGVPSEDRDEVIALGLSDDLAKVWLDAKRDAERSIGLRAVTHFWELPHEWNMSEEERANRLFEKTYERAREILLEQRRKAQEEIDNADEVVAKYPPPVRQEQARLIVQDAKDKIARIDALLNELEERVGRHISSQR